MAVVAPPPPNAARSVYGHGRVYDSLGALSELHAAQLFVSSRSDCRQGRSRSAPFDGACPPKAGGRPALQGRSCTISRVPLFLIITGFSQLRKPWSTKLVSEEQASQRSDNRYPFALARAAEICEPPGLTGIPVGTDNPAWNPERKPSTDSGPEPVEGQRGRLPE